MDWLQLLGFPLRMAASWLLVLASLVLALVGPPELFGVGLLKLVAWAIVLWVIVRYTTVLMRCMIEGVTDPPAFAIEMANPFESLPFRPALPLLLRAPQALGLLWLRLVALWGLCAAAVYGLALADGLVPRPLRYAVSCYCWWLAACALGAALHSRRAALGYAPLNSPERVAALQLLEHEGQRKRMLDQLYQQIRMQRYRSGAEVLNGWLAGLEPPAAEADARHVFRQLCLWGDANALARLTAILVGFLLQQRLGGVALEIIAAAERESTVFRAAELAESRALAELARRTGQQRLAERLEGQPS